MSHLYRSKRVGQHIQSYPQLLYKAKNLVSTVSTHKPKWKMLPHMEDKAQKSKQGANMIKDADNQAMTPNQAAKSLLLDHIFAFDNSRAWGEDHDRLCAMVTDREYAAISKMIRIQTKRVLKFMGGEKNYRLV